MNNDITTDIFKQYETGKSYKEKIDLYNTVNLNERFYAGDQWVGVESNGLPLPVFNFIRRVANAIIVKIGSKNTIAKFYPNGTAMDKNDMEKSGRKLSEAVAMSYMMNPTGPVTDDEVKAIAQLFNAFGSSTWKRLKMDMVNLSGLLTAFNAGDYINYFFWDTNIETGQTVQGNINVQTYDGVDTYFGNPTNKKIDEQPYIILAIRESIADLKAEALQNGAKQYDVDTITGDSDYQYQAGDRAKIELDDSSKCLVLLKLSITRNKDGRYSVKAEKSTKSCGIRPKWDTKLSKYPITMMNWDERKNSIHGIAETTGLIPNQVAVNKILAMEIVSTMNTAYPKVIIDENYVDGFSNAVGAIIPVREGVDNRVKYLEAPQNTGTGTRLADYIVSSTKEAMSANELSLGNTTGQSSINTLMLAIQQADIPHEGKQQRLYTMIEDTYNIFADFWLNYYNAERMLEISDENGTYYAPFDGRRYKDIMFNLKIEVGQSAAWNEALMEQRLNNAMQYDKNLPADLYFKYMPFFEGQDEMVLDIQKGKEQQALMEQQQNMPNVSQIPQQPQIPQLPM